MKTRITSQKTINLLCIFLIMLAFISKISLKFLKLIPYSITPIIFQYGLHPYINFAVQTIIFLGLFYFWIKRGKNKHKLSPIYLLFCSILIFTLSVQTILQIVFVNNNKSVIVQIAGLGMALTLIIFYGIIIPSLFEIKYFIKAMTKTGLYIVILSFFLLPFFSTEMFRGGRFTGLYKHIPHMVSAATFSFIFFLPKLFNNQKWTLQNNKILSLLIILILTICVLITATKAAIFTIIVALFAAIIFFPATNNSMRLFRFTSLTSVLVCLLFLGVPASDLAYKVSSGKINLGMRKAQDGIQSRYEEIQRGMEQFDRSPYLGSGLLYKFLNNRTDGIEVENYNSFKDPHNFFVSAALIGGYPLLLLSIIAYILMIGASVNGLRQEDPDRKIIAIFLLSHLPVFIIYHVNFSLGGLADRVYWLVFGYMGLSINQGETYETKRSF